MNSSLNPLLCPRSIAVLGASQRKGSVGNRVLLNLSEGDFAGRVFPINPRYNTIEGLKCYATLNDLPIRVDHVILALGDDRIESAFEGVIQHQAKACTIFTSLVLDDDEEPWLKERIKQAAEAAGILLFGANSMGFYNFETRVRICGFATRKHERSGNVALISQSGSGMAGIVDVDERIDFNFCASTGQELGVGLEDLLDYVLDLESTKVVGLFMETCRKPDRFIAALEKANTRQIPIVVLKVGKSELAATLAISHSGALAGQDAVYDAVFEKYGVQRVDDMNQLATTLIMFAQPHAVANGGLATIHDSGGERQLLADLAFELNVPLAILNNRSISALEKHLAPGMPAINPLDAWNKGGADADDIIKSCFSILLSDPGAALGAAVMDRGPAGSIFETYKDYLREAHAASQKPVFLVSNHQGLGADELALELTRMGFPVLDGLSAFMVGARCLMRYRDDISRQPDSAPLLPGKKEDQWHGYFDNHTTVDERTSSQWLSDGGFPMLVPAFVSSTAELRSLLPDLAFPVVLKTAKPDILHKSNVAGVKLDIKTADVLLLAYEEMSTRLGPKMILSPMIDEPGVEMMLGLVQDPEFGPVIVMGFGGVNTEFLDDVIMMMPPFDARMAKYGLRRLKNQKLLEGGRGLLHVDMDSFCEAAAIFSAIAIEFSNVLLEVDINPVKVFERGCLGLDALLISTTSLS